jgi:hypothetical protein
MTTWHAPPDVLQRYAGGAVDDVTACSIEAHLEHCAACRGALAASADPVLLEAIWDGVVDRVDQPRAHVIERALRGFGFDPGTARLVAATPALRLAWLAAVGLVTGLVVLACQATGSDGLFLAIAPLLPLAGVAAAFAPGVEPAGEVGAATPLFGFGLVLRRAELVLGTSFAILLAGALALPGLEARDAAWVLPALALACATVAMAGRAPVVPVAAALGAAWLIGLSLLTILDGAPSGLAETVAFAATGQVLLGLAAAAAVGAVLLRKDLDLLELGA